MSFCFVVIRLTFLFWDTGKSFGVSDCWGGSLFQTSPLFHTRPHDQFKSRRYGNLKNLHTVIVWSISTTSRLSQTGECVSRHLPLLSRAVRCIRCHRQNRRNHFWECRYQQNDSYRLISCHVKLIARDNWSGWLWCYRHQLSPIWNSNWNLSRILWILHHHIFHDEENSSINHSSFLSFMHSCIRTFTH
jgi:hypothetical protein